MKGKKTTAKTGTTQAAVNKRKNGNGTMARIERVLIKIDVGQDRMIDELQAIRHAVRDGMRVATTLGFGPRFLHSTGQLHKGGPNSGVFLQITSDDDEEIPIPGRRLGFGALKRAQAQGDFDVLADRDRRILRVHLGADLAAGLVQLRTGVRRALGKVLG